MRRLNGSTTALIAGCALTMLLASCKKTADSNPDFTRQSAPTMLLVRSVSGSCRSGFPGSGMRPSAGSRKPARSISGTCFQRNSWLFTGL